MANAASRPTIRRARAAVRAAPGSRRRRGPRRRAARRTPLAGPGRCSWPAGRAAGPTAGAGHCAARHPGAADHVGPRCAAARSASLVEPIAGIDPGPRAQSVAGIGRRPCGCTSPSSTEPDPVPTRTDLRLTSIAPGPSAGRVGVGLARRRRPHRPELQPLAAERRPGPGRGRAAPHQPVDADRGGRPVHPGVLDRELGRVGHARRPAAAPAARSPSSMPSSVCTSSPAPPSASRSSSVAGGVVPADQLGHHAEDRSGVQALLELEGRGAGRPRRPRSTRAGSGPPRARPAGARSAG